MGHGWLLPFAVAAGLAGCGGSSSADGEGERPPRAPFSSKRYGYRLTLPRGWRHEPTPGRWDGVLYPREACVDTFVDASGTRRVFVAARPVGRTVTAAEWAAEIAEGVPSPCSRNDGGKATVAGSEAQVAVYECSDGYVAINATLLRGGRGFALGWVSPSDGSAAVARGRRQFDAVLSSLAFTGSQKRGGS
jgi:hypothetical protein